MEVSAPLPTQICPWLSDRSGYDGTTTGVSDGQWLYCLKGTRPGDRQIVWSGVNGRGLIAVVDFSGAVRPRSAAGRYEGWGRITPLAEPVSVEIVRNHPVLAELFAKSIQSVRSIDDDAAEAIGGCIGEMPPAAGFHEHPVNWSEPSGAWGRLRRLPPEVIVEHLVLNRSRVARRIGFPGQVNPGGKKQILANGRIPDLWCAEGVVGDAKNQVNAQWGPQQIRDYIDQCDVQWPTHCPWHGILVQGVPEMAPSALSELSTGRHHDRIQVWSVTKRRVGYRVARLYGES
jgi:hypothetical protein